MATQPVSTDQVFASDNSSGAAPEIVAALTRAATGSALGYGADDFSRSAAQRVADIFECPVDVHYVGTGTAANALALSALVAPWAAVLCHPSAHIQVDECGAPEFFTGGAKLMSVPGEDGKIDPALLRRAVRVRRGDVHSPPAQVLSLSQATETGTTYSVDELRTLTSIARDAGMRVHMDGARFANALADSGVSPAEATWRSGIDILSFGITKNGGLTTDALVSFDPLLSAELAHRAKRAGQLLSKQRFAAAQLDAYLTDDLWLRNAGHANAMARRLEAGLRTVAAADIVFPVDADMVFCRLPDGVLGRLVNQGFVFHHGIPEPDVARLVTSFSTDPDAVDALVSAIAELCAQSPGASESDTAPTTEPDNH